MSIRIDLAAASLLFPYHEQNEDFVRYALLHKAWLPKGAIDPNRNPLYVEWSEKGYIEVTPGEVTDYSVIEEWLRGVARRFDLRNCGYDPYALMQFSQNMRNEGYPMLEYRMTTLNMSEPTKMLDSL